MVISATQNPLKLQKIQVEEFLGEDFWLNLGKNAVNPVGITSILTKSE